MPGPLSKKTNGRDFNFYQKNQVSSSLFTDDCDMIITFPTQGVLFSLEGTGVIQYSFNGNTIHGEMDSSKSSKDLTFNFRNITKIWFKLISGGPLYVRVEAWGN